MKKLHARALVPGAALVIALTGVSSGAIAAPQPDADLSQAGPSAHTGKLADQQAKKDRANQKRYDRIVAKLPADWEQRRDALRERFGIEDSPARTVLESKLAYAQDKADRGVAPAAIDPTDYECGPTALDGYIDSILAEADTFNLLLLQLMGALDVPAYDAILSGSPKDDAYDLLPAYEQKLTATMGHTQRFWDVRLNDVQLVAMHGEMLTDVNRVASTIEYMYDVGPADAVAIAEDMIAMIKSDPALKKGKNPIFSLNAFAFTGDGDPDPVIRRLKDKVIFGDGILRALKAIGLNNVGGQSVLAHEMAHHVQFEDDLFDSDLEGPEATRRTELMADGFGTYFLTHKKGEGFAPAKVLKVGKSFYAVGDCSFDSPGHHGTPNQRLAASSWGAAEVAYSENPNKVLPSLRLATKFEKILPQLLAPDAPVGLTAYKNAV